MPRSTRRASSFFSCNAGIYGPGRSALDAVKQHAQSANQLRRDRKRYTARCHVHDVWQAVHASMGSPGIEVVNVVDDDSAPRWVVATTCVVHFATAPSQQPLCRVCVMSNMLESELDGLCLQA